MERVEEITQEFAADLERGEVGPGNLLDRLEEASRLEPYLLGLTVAYAPNAYADGRRLYAPSYSVDSGSIVLCEDFYDYTDPGRREDALWYQEAARDGPGVWVAGFGPAAGTTYVGYSVPFFAPDAASGGRVLAGVVNMSVSLEDLNDLLNKENVGRLGCGILIDEGGLLLAHPNLDAARAGLTLAENARGDDNPELAALAERMRAGESGSLRMGLKVGGSRRAGWFSFRPINASGWSLLVGIFENELYRARDELRRRQVLLALTAPVALTVAAALALRVDRLQEPRLWGLSVASSLLMIAAIALIWGLAGSDPPRGADGPGDDSRVIGDLRGLGEFLEAQGRLGRQSPFDEGLFKRS